MKLSKERRLQHSELEKLKVKVDTVFKVSAERLEKLTKGVSNNNYLMVSKGESYLLKCYSHGIPTEALKAQNELAQQGITSKVLQYDLRTRMALFTFMPEVCAEPKLNTALLAQVIQVHSLELEVYEVLDLAGYVQAIDKELRYLVDIAWLIESLASLPVDQAFCHNDLVMSNIIQTPEGGRLIDFEYACHSDIFFDLAALVCSFSCGVEEALTVVESYFSLKRQAMPSYAQAKLTVFCQIYLIVSIQWYEQRGVMIEPEKLRQLLKQWIL
ncbi:phosphotransferase [Pseudoalteromonas sp. NC201]|uniref:phosphotransferase n=1 Tax=Pseudoalteromonas sp. NC201 TaxID=1514074 RepID=UPI001F405029|nr:phosphotransferase [Pseudoalteromonas sp. NC201]